MVRQYKTIDITQNVLKSLTKAGYVDDSTGSSNITKAGIWELMDAISGMNNKKFTVAEAQKELARRGL